MDLIIFKSSGHDAIASLEKENIFLSTDRIHKTCSTERFVSLVRDSYSCQTLVIAFVRNPGDFSVLESVREYLGDIFLILCLLIPLSECRKQVHGVLPKMVLQEDQIDLILPYSVRTVVRRMQRQIHL